MRKPFFHVCLIALVIVFCACRREAQIQPIVWESPLPYEGVFAPDNPIDHITIGTEGVEQWHWDDAVLSHIEIAGETTGKINFCYADGKLVRVANNTDNGSVAHYSYANGEMNRIITMVDGKQCANMIVNHDYAGRISGADINLTGSYLFRLIKSAKAGELAMASNHMIEGAAINTLADELEWIDLLKEDLDDKQVHNFTLTYNWHDFNVMSEMLNGSVQLELDAQRIVQDMSILPENIRQWIYNYLQSHNKLPIRISFSNTVTYTFDTKNNPFYGYWGDGLSVRALSKNNVLESKSNGLVTTYLLIGDKTYTLYRHPIDKHVVRDYHYNDSDYPIQISGNELTIISYRHQQ